jgi:hypothetical protein
VTRSVSKRTTLAATARKGPRTGAAEISWDVSEAIADNFLRAFDDNCVDAGMIKPPSYWEEPVTVGVAIVGDLKAGQPLPIEIVMAPSSGAFQDRSLPVIGQFDPLAHRITISPTRGACKSVPSWKNILLSAIRHELAHAVDPGLRLTNVRGIRWEEKLRRWVASGGKGKPPSLRELPKTQRREVRKRLEEYVKGRPAPVNFCQYVRSVPEERAFLTQVASEMELVGRRLIKARDQGFKNPTEAIKALSPTYREIEKCLTPKGRRKYLKVAASAWERGVVPIAKR